MEWLLERCFQSPLASKGSSGITVCIASEGASSPFSAGLRDRLVSTSAWCMICGHRGDIRQCPA